MSLKTWALRKLAERVLKETGMGGFLAKLFSLDSIWSRIIRAILLAVIGQGTGGIPDLHLPAWAIAILAAIAGLIPAGQNNPSPAAPEVPKAVPPTA